MTVAVADPHEVTCAQCGEVIEMAAFVVADGVARHAYAKDCPPPVKELPA